MQTPSDEVLGLRHKGRVAVGADADLVVLDAGWQVRHTIIRGQIVQSAQVLEVPA